MSKVVDAFRQPWVFIKTPVQASCRVERWREAVQWPLRSPVVGPDACHRVF